jgi:hypothetical protein
MELELNERVAALAARQHGVVTRAQVRAIDVSDKAIEHEVETGGSRSYEGCTGWPAHPRPGRGV